MKVFLYKYSRVHGYEEEKVFSNFIPKKIDGFGVEKIQPPKDVTNKKRYVCNHFGVNGTRDRVCPGCYAKHQMEAL